MANAAFWARKRLEILPAYLTVRATDAAVEADRLGLVLCGDESLLGVYTNPSGVVQRRVAVTSAAIATDDGFRWTRVPYAGLVEMVFDGGKSDWDVLTLVDRSGGTWPIHMPGEPEKPVASLSTFLTKVSAARRVFVNRPDCRHDPWFGPGGRRERECGSPHPTSADLAMPTI